MTYGPPYIYCERRRTVTKRVELSENNRLSARWMCCTKCDMVIRSLWRGWDTRRRTLDIWILCTYRRKYQEIFVQVCYLEYRRKSQENHIRICLERIFGEYNLPFIWRENRLFYYKDRIWVGKNKQKRRKGKENK